MGGIAATINALTAPMARRVKLAVRRAIVKLVYDEPQMQELQLAIFAGEVRDHVERFEEYGLTSHPHPGAEALVLALGGSTAHSAVVTVADRRYRLTELAEGEVALYDDQGQVIHLKRNKTIHIYGCDHLVADIGVASTITCPQITAVASTKVTLDTPLLEVTGAITSGADITAAGEVADAAGSKTMSGMRQVYDGHTHPENDNGGPTSAPDQGM